LTASIVLVKSQPDLVPPWLFDGRRSLCGGEESAARNMDNAKIQVGSVARKPPPRRLQIPLWLFMLFVPFATLAIVIVVKHVQERRDYLADFDALQGDWELVQLARNGETREVDHGSWTITGNNLQSRLTFEDRYATFRIYPNRSPKEIVFTFIHDPQGYDHGIYSIDTGTLTLCLTSEKNPRPRDFFPGEGSDNVLLVFRRERH